MENRVFLIVLDSFGIGNASDAEKFHDAGSNTLASIMKSDQFHAPNMERLGLFAIDGVEATGNKEGLGAYGRLQEASMGKDTTIGHWEIAGIISPTPLPTYPDGFPEEIIQQFEQACGQKVLCNKPYSGTEVIMEYGQQHVETGALIVYTSADSVFQIAAHEEIVPPEQLYEYCRIAREILQGEHGVGRVIARPFTGEYPNYQRTPRRHDFSLLPPKDTMLDALSQAGYTTIGVGKIYDIFAGKGIGETYSIKNNTDGMNQTKELLGKEFQGLCFVNLVDFDMVYGHRNDVDGYANAISEFDTQLQQFMAGMREDDILIITADHGCDPGSPGTDHTRECVPVMFYGNAIQPNVNLGTRTTYADLGATILEIFGLDNITDGTSFWNEVKQS